MGKKGVLLDNGKSAQSSMALYWKKNRQQSKNPKKQYEPTQQQQLDQRVQSGFQKWKLHKQKIISKAYQKKEKLVQTKKQQNKQQQEQQQFEIKGDKNKGPINIPGFKSKQLLRQKLKPEQAKQVSQHDNILKLPSHVGQLSQEDIIRILREKKTKTQKKRQQQQKEDVILGQDFLQSFRQTKKQKQDEQTEKKQEKMLQVIEQKQQKFFKSDILNQVSRGDHSVLMPKQKQEQILYHQQKSPKQVPHQSKLTTQEQPPRFLFKPRVLNNKK